MMSEINLKAKLSKMQTRHWVALLTLFLIGASMIFAANVINKLGVGHLAHEFHLLLHELGILFVSIVPMIFIYERILRNSFLMEVEETMTDVISKQMPENIGNIRRSGLVEIEEKLRYDKVLRHIEKTTNSKIRFLKIWIPSSELFHKAIFEAIIYRKCEVEIILLNPNCVEAIEKRGKAYNYDVNRIQNHIIDNLKDLAALYQKLPLEYRDKLTIKLHRDFIGLSLIGIENTFIVGLYLHGRLATEGIQLKVQGKGTPFYNELYVHFKNQWIHSEMIDLSNPYFINKIMDLLPEIDFMDSVIEK